MEILPIIPQYMPKIWGGQQFGYDDAGKVPIGELWSISDLSEGCCLTSQGKLSDHLKHPLTYLIKFIDTQDNLSVQVHPTDEYAHKYENSNGKSECWLVLKAEAGAGIYLGFKDKIDIADFKNLVLKGEDISKLLRFIPVEEGDFFYVPAGTIHAIGKGILLTEVQQSSGITYRVWDWNRLDHLGRSRDLHLKQSLDVLRFEESFNQLNTFKYQRKILSYVDGNPKLPISHPDFECEILSLKMSELIEFKRNVSRPLSVVCLKGKLSLWEAGGETKFTLNSFESVIIPYGESLVALNVFASEDCSFLVVY